MSKGSDLVQALIDEYGVQMSQSAQAVLAGRWQALLDSDASLGTAAILAPLGYAAPGHSVTSSDIQEMQNDPLYANLFQPDDNNEPPVHNVDRIFTLQDVPDVDAVHEGVLSWGYNPDDEDNADGNDENPDDGGIPAADLLDFLRNIAGVDLVELGLIDDDGVDPAEAVSNISNITIGDVANDNGSTLTITTNDGQVLTAEALLGERYMEFLSDLIFDEEGNSRLYMADVVTQEAIEGGAIVLTPTENNGGTIESGLTTADNDLIVCGRLDILHGAYIDGGDGYNTLEVDAKGIYAQPLQLLNIQEVSIENLPNVYGDTENDPDYDAANEETSVIDLSRAMDLERLVITEGWDMNADGIDIGDLSVIGIRNDAVVALEGGFTQAVNLHFGRDMGDSVTLELNLGDTDGFELNVAHNTNTLNFVSEGNENWIEAGTFGGMLRTINVSGDAALYIEEDLADSFHDARTATIDASANTGGVEMTLNGHGSLVHFIGTVADDEFTSMGGHSVNIEGLGGNDTYTVDGTTDVNITTRAGNDTISAMNCETVVIDAGDGDNSIVTTGETVVVTTGEGSDVIAIDAGSITVNSGEGNDLLYISGSLNDEVADNVNDDEVIYEDGALLNIDMGGGSNVIHLGLEDAVDGVTALAGSVITGEDITIYVDSPSDLTEAALSGVSSVVLDEAEDILRITDTQFGDLGAGAFSVDNSAIKGEDGVLKIVVTQDTTLGDLVDFSQFDENVKLQLEIQDGVTLTMTAEELHKYVTEDGVTADDANGYVDNQLVITNAGLDFDPFDQQNDGDEGGTVDDTLGNNDLTVIRDVDGFERPEEDPYSDSLTITSTGGENNVIDGLDAPAVDTLILDGDEDMTFTDSVDLADGFTIDFSAHTANVIDLTIADFQQVEEIIGNGTEANPVRVNVEIADGGAVGAAGLTNGLTSSGVQTYVVTDIYEDGPDGNAFSDAQFFVCDSTQDIETLGFKGNGDAQITFSQVNWQTSILLEGDGLVNWDDAPKAFGNPNSSNIGSVIVEYFEDGAPAVIDINNGGVALGETTTGEDRPLLVDGITLTNADSLEINVADGDAEITALQATDDIQTLTLTAVDDLTIGGNLPNSLEAVDASAVAGEFTVAFEDHAGVMDFVGSDGGTTLTLTDVEFAEGSAIDGGTAGATIVIEGDSPNDGEETDLSDTALTNINAIHIAEDDAEVTLGFDQLLAVGVDNLTIEDGLGATLNLTVFGEDPFVAPDVADGIAIGDVIIGGADTITLDPTTDLTGVQGLNVEEGTTLNLTAEQLKQLGNETIVGEDGTTNYTVNITDLTQADVDLDEDGDGDADGIDLSFITADTLTVTLAESVDLNDACNLGDAEVIMGDDMTLGLTTEAQADGLVVGGGTNTTVQLNFVALGGNIDAGGYDVDVLRVDDELVQDQNVEVIFTDLDSSVLVQVTDFIDGVAATNRRVEIEPGVSVDGELVFNDVQVDREVTTLTLTLDGDSHITGELRLPTVDAGTLDASNFDTLTINSEGDAVNTLGDINALDTDGVGVEIENNLLNVVVNGTQDLEVGNITFSAMADNDDATAELTVNSAAAVEIGGVDFTDGEVDHFVVTQTGTGALTVTLDGNDDDLGGELAINGSATGTLNIVIAEDEVVDLSEATLTNVDAILLETGDGDANRTTLTLNLDQITAVGIDNITVSDVDDDAILNIGNYDGSEFDFGALETDGIDVGTVTFDAGDDIDVNAATDFTGVDDLVVPEGTNVVMSAEQFKQLVDSGAQIATNGAGDDQGTVTVDLDGNLEIGDDDALTIGVSNVTFLMADGEVLDVSDFDLADGLQVQGDDAAVVKPLVNFSFESDAGGRFNATINVADYQDVDVRILDALLDNFWIDAGALNGVEDPGENSQSIEDLLADLDSANILNIYQEEVVVDLDPRDREVVVESLAAPDGIEFSAEGALADYVRSIDLTLEADADSAASIDGDIIVNDGQVDAGYTMLTINAEDTDAAAVDPVFIDGDIISNDGGAGDNGELLTVTINANHDILISDVDGDTNGGAIVFNSNDAEGDAEATLTLNGAGDITIDTLDITDPDIDTLNIVNNATGVVNVPGASPAITLAAGGGDDLSNIVITGTGDSMTFGTSDDPDTELVDESNSGVNADDLEGIDASGYAGDLDLGIVTGTVGVDAALTITGSDGVTTLTLGAANDDNSLDLDAEEAFTMNAQADVTIDLSGSAAGSQVVITEDAVLPDMTATAAAAAGSLTILGDLVIDGIVDFRELVDLDGTSKLDLAGVDEISVNEGGAMLLTDDQWDALSVAQQAAITGDGLTLNLMDADAADLIDGVDDGIIDLTDVRGVTAIQVDEFFTDDLRLTVAQAAMVTTGTFVDDVFAPSTWDDDNDGGTADVDTEAGNLTQYDGDVFIYADGAAQDVSDLEIDGDHGDRILLTINDPADVDTELTVRHEANNGVNLFDQVSYIDTAAEADGTPDEVGAIDAGDDPAAILAEVTSLTVDVEVDTGNTDIEGNPILVDSSFTFTNDAVTIDVEGNAAAIGTAMRDENTTEIGNLLDEADTVLWQVVGSTASVSLVAGVGDDLVATDADDTFEYAANVDADDPIYIGGFDDAGTDLIDLTAMGAEAVVQLAAGNVTDTVDGTPTIYVTTNDATASDFNPTTDDNHRIADFTDLADVADWLTDSSEDGLVLGNSAGDEDFVVINDGTDSYIYLITDAGGDTDIAAGELQLIGVVDDVLTNADFTVV